jgi:hypothetical protein
MGFTDNNTALAKENIPGIDLTNPWKEFNLSSSEFFTRINDPKESKY